MADDSFYVTWRYNIRTELADRRIVPENFPTVFCRLCLRHVVRSWPGKGRQRIVCSKCIGKRVRIVFVVDVVSGRILVCRIILAGVPRSGYPGSDAQRVSLSVRVGSGSPASFISAGLSDQEGLIPIRITVNALCAAAWVGCSTGADVAGIT